MAIPGTPEEFRLAMFINGPVALVRMLWTGCFVGKWSTTVFCIGFWWWDAFFIASVGIFWYWIALNISSWRERRVLLLPTSMPLRVTTDLLLIALGPCFVWFSRDIDLIHLWQQGFVVAVPFLLIWSVGPVFVFGRDLVRCLFTASAARRLD
jgi:hypothetical protein